MAAMDVVAMDVNVAGIVAGLRAECDETAMGGSNFGACSEAYHQA
jgi:hypothetical protein